MKSKINIRLIGISFLAVMATVIGITFIYYGLLERQVRSDLSVSAKLLKDTRFFESENTDSKKIDLSTDIDELRVTWIDKDGTVLYDNDASAEYLSNHNDRPEIKSAFLAGEGEAVRKSDTMNKDTFYYAVLLDNGTVLRVATNVQSLWSVFISVAPVVAFIIFLIIVICIIISHFLTKQLLRPIELMAENLEDTDYESPYRELDPLAQKLATQHTDILAAAKARQDFTANVSHELKTPLTAISGYAELLGNGMVGEDKKTHFYLEIKRNADRLLLLINDIINLSELDQKDFSISFEETDLYEIANGCLGELIIAARKRGVNIRLLGEKCMVRGNKDLLKELIENLAANAIRYNNPGGEVEISISNKGGAAVLKVKDNGIGISDSDKQRVFERFYRVDKSRSKETGGTGLGLAIVKHIVEIHDAKIKLVSTLGEGTVITVVF